MYLCVAGAYTIILTPCPYDPIYVLQVRAAAESCAARRVGLTECIYVLQVRAAAESCAARRVGRRPKRLLCGVLWPPVLHRAGPHFQFYWVVSVIRWRFPYKKPYNIRNVGKTSKMVKLMQLRGETGRRCGVLPVQQCCGRVHRGRVHA